MGRLTSNPISPSARRPSTSRSRLQWPKDVSWSMTFLIVVPFTLLLPIWFAKNPNSSVWIATAVSPRLATLHTLFWGLGVGLVLSRLLYRTAGGGDGDDARHFASQILLASAPISISVFIMLAVAIKVFTPRAWMYAVIPLWYLARDVYLFRQWKMTATTPGGRQAFFQALTCMTLDILSRSLRRNTLWRTIVVVIVAQFFIICWWRMALLAAIQSQSVIWIVVAAMGGKWATGTVARLLTLIACGGISNWFEEQSSLVEEMQQHQQQQQQQQQQKSTTNDTPKIGTSNDDEEMIEFSSISQQHSHDSMPEAYRSADASAYKSILQHDGMENDVFEDEDDDEDDDDDDIEQIPNRSGGSFNINR